MKLKFCLFILLGLILQSICFAQVLKGNVVYTVELARNEAFQGVDKQIDMSVYKEYFIDKNYSENKYAISKGRQKYKNRFLTNFSDGSYGVSYSRNKKINYYYDQRGTLEYIEFETNDFFPRKSVAYDIDGKFDSVVFSVDGNTSFLFDKYGELKYKWIGKHCYNNKGELIKIRK